MNKEMIPASQDPLERALVPIKGGYFKLLGWAVLLGALFFNPWMIGKFFAVDGHIQSQKVIAMILGMDFLGLLFALWFFLVLPTSGNLCP